MEREYCTYFDHRYAARGLAMIRSLRRQVATARVWVLCMDDQTEQILRQIDDPGLRTISLAEFEAGDVPLQKAKADGRSTMEYYFTCTASLVRYVMGRADQAQFVTYLDGDLSFFADPEPIYSEAGDASVIIIPHRFPPRGQHRNIYGTYNVGWLTFRRTESGLACLEWWRDRTLEWCSDTVDEANDRFADQRYLDRFARLFKGVHSLDHPGANLAPWNIAGHKLSLRDDEILVDGKPLIFFHFHGLKRIGKSLYLTSHGIYGAQLSALVRDRIYRPYLREVRAIEHEVSGHLTVGPAESIRHGAGRRGIKQFLRDVRGHVRAAYTIARGLTVRIDSPGD